MTPDHSIERARSGLRSLPYASHVKRWASVMRAIGSFVRKYRAVLMLAFLSAWCAVAGVLMWRAKTASPTFMEAELAACIKRCSPLRAELETARQERAYQQPSWRGPGHTYAVCKCIHN
jgi:hypothetical protein